ncbi:2Fe-2S iron-sulfur cluster-binding protein [Acetobacteroides hydrogenigenes]|uniref:2Fe-2S type ferredoxin n=1 Tax=Acetobacteroides hydrogenigenes TaxID=979970 RepID=A0A4R2E6R2_9BACT|nr:2Fe-2S iron-sulfur cluster-binding protein [Acetobacteroides hydrogenigenes]TCN62132.1 2Fe-2S type ferredoxin [Acetobacteroides hydrogenigenes]
MKIKHIFALLLVGIAFVGCHKEGIEPENSKEKEAIRARKQLFQDLSSLAAANRMLALTDFKSTSENLTSKDLERTDADIDRLVEYFFRVTHNSMLHEKIVRYTVDKDSRFWSTKEDAAIADYEAKVRELRSRAIFAMWNCTTRASLLSEIEAYQKQRNLLFRSTSADNQAYDTKVSEPSWHKAKYLKSAKVYKVTLILPWGTYEIDCRDDQYILDAAEENGISLPYSSRAGVEPSSAGLLVSGSVDQSDQQYLDRDQISMGFVLLDVAYPKSDCSIKTHMEELLFKTMPIPMTGDIDELVIIGERPYNPDPNTDPNPDPDPDTNEPNGTGGPFIIPNPIPFDPCSMATRIASTPNLSTYIKELLQNAKTSNVEFGTVINNRGICTPYTGLADNCIVGMSLNTYVATMIHSHPSQCGAIFSAGDIKVMWDAYRTGHADPASFNYGVATSYNTVYFLSIADGGKFAAFAKNWGLTNGYGALEGFFNETFKNQVWDLNSYELETKFLQFIDNAGLMLFTKITDDDYDPLTRDGLGNPINIKC